MSIRKPDFRKDLNGLRGIAIIIVLFFHAFPYHRYTNGGFIGVDVFFVLSGYLITKPLLSEKLFNLEDYKSFIGKRVKRIIPALSLVLLFLLMFGFFAYDKNEYKILLREIFYSGTFLTNYLHIDKSSYFDPSSYSYNLLHTWSLSIEAQFYFIFPLVLFLLRNRFKSLIVFFIAFCLSFFVCIFTVEYNSRFYGFSSRVWEILAGVLCAYLERYFLKSKLSENLIRAVLPYFGLVLIIFGGLFNSQNNSPGWNSLLPVLGTSFVIVGSQKTRVTKLVLENRILRFFGDISYSLYLWHWVLLSISFLMIGHSNLLVKSSLLIISIFIASLSTFFIENPIRKSKNTLSIVFLFSIILIVSQVFNLSSLVDNKVSANKKEIRTGYINHADFYNYLSNFPSCLPNGIYLKSESFGDKHRCYQSSDGAQDVAIIGDSHGEHIFPGLAKVFPNKNFVYYLTNRNLTLMNEQNSEIAKIVINNPSIKYVIINSYWNASKINSISLSKFIAQFTQANKIVYLFNDVPDFNFDVKNCKYIRSFLNINSCSRDFSGNWRLNEELLRSAVKFNDKVFFIDTLSYFCDSSNGKCSMNKDDLVLFRDYNHLNIEGSIYIARELQKNSILFFG